MPPRKRKVSEKTDEATVEDNPTETPKKNDKNAQGKGKGQKKQKSDSVEGATSPQTAEKHVVLKILLNAQTNEAFNSKYIKELTNQYAKVGHEKFLSMFICCLKQLLEKEESVAQYANVGLQFMAKFATSMTNEGSEDMHVFLEAVFDWVLKTISLSHNIRSRLCKFVNLLLDSLGSNASLDDTLFDNILKYMFDRLKDLHPPVRVQAIKALQRLQMPDDPDDPIVKIYTFHLASDPSSVVRQAVLTCLGRNIHTIPIILERLWDIDEKVRRHVYVHMANYPVKTYKVIHRLTFLEQGLNDRSDSVRRAVTGIMIPQWLESYNKNYLAFLSGLKLDASDTEIDRFRATARLALSEIFKTQKPEDLISALSLDNDENSTYPKCIPFEKLTIESSLLWCSLIAYFQQDDRRSDYLELVIPELSIFCRYVEKYNDTIICEEKEPWEIIVAQGILFNLIEILVNFDYGDEIGRQRLRSLAVHLLTNNPCNENIIVSLVHICEKLILNSDDRLQLYVDVIRSLVDQDVVEKTLNFMDPNVVEAMEKDPNLKVQVSSLKLKLYELKEEESKFVKVKDYASVSRIAEEISSCQDRLVTLIRPLMTGASSSLQQKRITKELQIKALKLAFHGVCSKSVSKLNPAMSQLYTDFIRLKIESSEMDVRNWALKCGATFSLLYEQLAKDVFAALNKQFFDHHHTDVWTTSVGAMFQLIDRYGFSYFDEDPNSEVGENKQKDKPKKSRLLYNTTDNVDDTEDDGSIEKGNVTIKGLIYLFGHFMDTCDDIHLMSALIDGFGLLILHGVYVDEKLVSRLILLYFNPTTEAEVNQILSIFFETLIHHKKQECLESALIQTLTKVIEASSESPLHEVKIDTILKFIISSTMPMFCNSGSKIHDNIALSLLKWMKNNAANRDVVKMTSKEILSLEISDDNTVRQKSQDYIDELLELPMDSRSEKNLKLFKEKMQGNHKEEIQFSSVAPANGVDGELDHHDDAHSDMDSSHKNDEEDGSEVGDDAEKSPNRENSERDSQNQTSDDGPSELNESTVETPVQKENIEEASSAKKRTLAEDANVSTSDTIAPRESYYTSNDDTIEEAQQFELRVDVHTVPVASSEAIESPSPTKIRKRAPHLTEQSQQNSPVIQSAPVAAAAQKKKKQENPPSKSSARTVSERTSLKRKSDAMNADKGDPDEIPTKKSKRNSEPEVFSEKTDKRKSKKTTAVDQQTPVERPTRRSRPTETTDSADKRPNRTNVEKNKESKPTKATQKQTTSNISTKSKSKVDEMGNAQKETVSKDSTKSAEKISNTRLTSRSNRGTRTSSQSVENLSFNNSSRKSSTNKTPVVTPQPSTINKRTGRQRLIASEPPKTKANSKTSENAISPKAQKDKSSKLRSSLDNPSILNKPQHRTRRAIANEFKVNNVMTRNRSSADGNKVSVRVRRLSPTKISSPGRPRKNVVQTASPGRPRKNVIQTASPGRPKRIAEKTSSTTPRSRRLSAEKK